MMLCYPRCQDTILFPFVASLFISLYLISHATKERHIYIYIKFGRPLLLSVMLDWETVKMFSRHQSGLVSDIHEEHDIPQRV